MKISDIITFEDDFKKRLESLLESKNKSNTVSGMLELTAENNVLVNSVSFRSLLSFFRL